MFPVGVTIEHGAWQVHLMGGRAYNESRRVSADCNPFFPGHYTLDQSIFGLQVTRFLEGEKIASG